MSSSFDNTAPWRRDLLLLFVAIGLFFAFGLNDRPYLTPSEARYIELPRQMIVTGDWLTPRINGVPYFEKPPLFYWMQASFMQVFGLGEFSGRFVTLLMVTFTCLLTYSLGRLLYGRLAGLLATTVLATCLVGYGLSRVAMLDAPVSFFLTGCIGAFLAAQHVTSPVQRRNLYLLMYVCSALAILTKGLIGIVVPGMVIGAWIILGNRWRLLREVHLVLGLAIVLAIAAPWHVLMDKAHPEFTNFYFIHEHFTRYLTPVHKRTEPWWFFSVVLLVGLLPWIGLLPSALKRLNWRLPLDSFLLLWIVLPFLFFSSSQSKLLPYIFPIFPPLALLIGHQLARLWRGDIAVTPLKRNAVMIVVLFGILLVAAHVVPLPNDPDRKIDLTEIIDTPAIYIIAAAWGLLVATLLWRRPTRQLIVMIALFGAITDMSLNHIASGADQATIKPLLAHLNDPNKEALIVSYGTYYQDLPIYLNQNITVAYASGELDFGIKHYPETRAWMITREQFVRGCAASKDPIFVFAKRNTLRDSPIPKSCPLKVVASYGKNLLLQKVTP